MHGELGGVEGVETVSGLYCIEEESIFSKK